MMTSTDARRLVEESFSWLATLTPEERDTFTADAVEVLNAVGAAQLERGSTPGTPYSAVAVMIAAYTWGMREGNG